MKSNISMKVSTRHFIWGTGSWYADKLSRSWELLLSSTQFLIGPQSFVGTGRSIPWGQSSKSENTIRRRRNISLQLQAPSLITVFRPRLDTRADKSPAVEVNIPCYLALSLSLPLSLSLLPDEHSIYLSLIFFQSCFQT